MQTLALTIVTRNRTEISNPRKHILLVCKRDLLITSFITHQVFLWSKFRPRAKITVFHFPSSWVKNQGNVRGCCFIWSDSCFSSVDRWLINFSISEEPRSALIDEHKGKERHSPSLLCRIFCITITHREPCQAKPIKPTSHPCAASIVIIESREKQRGKKQFYLKFLFLLYGAN